MRILHTSDWHLGRQLYGKSRYEEQERFLFWLSQLIDEKQVDALLVSGDIFDTTTPSNRSAELYYQFLTRLIKSCCRHVVITAGNHDSPSFLNAPKEILKELKVHLVTGVPGETVEDELILLKDEEGTVEMIVAAVPYLRESAIRTPALAESVEDKVRNLIAGLTQHYHQVAQLAISKREECGRDIPVVAMGHLFAVGGKTVEDDGVRELYVGNLTAVGANIFSSEFDYVALGHLHLAQPVGGNENIRYSGSPMPMGFGELSSPKSLVIVEFQGREPTLEKIEIPVFQQLVKICGDEEQLVEELKKLIAQEKSIWVELNYEGREVIPDLKGKLDKLVEGSRVEILKFFNPVVVAQIFQESGSEELLEELTPQELFERRLNLEEITEEKRSSLRVLFNEVYRSVLEEDRDRE